MKTHIEPRCIKAPSAAEYLGISQRYLRVLSAAGKIPFHRIGTRTIVYRVAELDSFLAGCRVIGGAK